MAGSPFDREVRAMLRRAPWYAISLAVHVLALLALDLVVFQRARSAPEPKLTVALRRTLEPVEGPPDYEPKVEPEEPEEPLIDDSEEADLEPIEPERDNPLPPERDLSRRIPRIGLSGTPIRGGAAEAHAKIARESGGGGALRGLARDRILVRKGELDRIEEILRLHSIPHTVVANLRERELRPSQVLLIDCGRRPLAAPKRRLRAFVESGGWLLSTDWALDHFVAPAFPELVRLAKPRRPQHRDVVVAIEAAAPRHPLLEGVFPRRRGRVLWWLEPESSFFRVDPERATVLVKSAELAERFGLDVVAFTARAGKGRVVHLLGHLYQEHGNMEGLAVMHRLLLNFLRAATRR